MTTATLPIPDLLIQSGFMQTDAPVKPGELLVIQGGKYHGRRCTYIGPHAKRSGECSGKFRVQAVDTKHELVVGPRQLHHAPPPKVEAQKPDD